MFANPPADEIRDLLRSVRTIAVVGLSPRNTRPSHRIARALQGYGYRIVPVRPAVSEVLGERAYGQLTDVPGEVDLVNVFRAAEHVDAIVDQCLQRGLKRLWLQDGIINEGAARRARDAGMTVVMDRCAYKDYVSLMSP